MCNFLKHWNLSSTKAVTKLVDVSYYFLIFDKLLSDIILMNEATEGQFGFYTCSLYISYWSVSHQCCGSGLRWRMDRRGNLPCNTWGNTSFLMCRGTPHTDWQCWGRRQALAAPPLDGGTTTLAPRHTAAAQHTHIHKHTKINKWILTFFH